MKTTFLILLLTFSLYTCFAQNLVPNPSFEDTVACPDNISQISKTKDWYRIGGTPDYYNACSSSFYSTVPINFMGHQYPPDSTCKAYIGILTYNVSVNEYIGAKLTTPLVVGQRYFVSIKASLPDTCKIASNNIGVLFRTSLTLNTYIFPITNFSHIKSNEVISDKDHWTKIFGSFIADSTYKYIIIGNFYDNNITDTLILSGIGSQGYYYIDDICVSTDSLYCFNYKFKCTVGISSFDFNNEFKIFPNPFIDKLNIILRNEGDYKDTEIILCDIFGRVLKRIKQNTNNIEIYRDGLKAGIYFISIINSNMEYIKKIIIN